MRENIKLLLKRFALILIIFQICRLLFIVFNHNKLGDLSFLNLLRVMFIGIRFDITAVSYTNIITLLPLIFAGKYFYNKTFQKIMLVLFFMMNAIIISMNFIDFEYFKFTGKRSTFAMITAQGMQGDLENLLPSFAKQFWYIIVILIILLVIFWKLIPRLNAQIDNEKTFNFKKYIVIILLFLILFFLGGRGGTQGIPLSIVHVSNYGDLKNSSAILNTPFCVFRSLSSKNTITKKLFFNKNRLHEIYSANKYLKSDKPFSKKNVIVIILESFGKEKFGFGITPFIDSLKTKSLYFDNGFANGNRSIDAIPSVISGLTKLINSSYLFSDFSTNEITSLPKILKKKGYSSGMFHGAKVGSQNFDSYAVMAEFDNYYGKRDFPNPKNEDLDGVWGIFDEPFFQFFGRKITQSQKPYLGVLFSISSHNPYVMPEKYKNKFPKGNSKLHPVVAYTDYSLKKFFEYAKKQDWYNNTLFVITPDHTSIQNEIKKPTIINQYSIPIIFFDPSNPKISGIVNHNLMSQIDIMPSILSYLNYSGQIISFGDNIFDNSKNKFTINRENGIYYYFNEQYHFTFDGKKALGLYDYKKDEKLKNNLLETNPQKTKEIENITKAFIQEFNQRMIDNQLIAK